MKEINEKLLTEDDHFSEVVEKPHWYWGSWVCLALTATCCFMCCNLIIARLSFLGFEAIFYFSGGASLYAIAYFVIQSRRQHKNRRVLLFTEGQFDPTLLACYVIGALFGASIFFSIAYTFKCCARAGLNIGIAQTIWTLAPGLTSVLEFLIYK
jgi:hypothetical protein